MSEAAPPPTPRAWRFYLGDMIEFSEKVPAYSGGFDQPRFERTGLDFDATLRNLELIGESATRIIETDIPRLPDDLRELKNAVMSGRLREPGT